MSPWTDLMRKREEAIQAARQIANSRDATRSSIPGQEWTTEDARLVARMFLKYLGEKLE